MHVLMLLDKSFPTDIRVDKEITGLLSTSDDLFTIEVAAYLGTKSRYHTAFGDRLRLSPIAGRFERVLSSAELLIRRRSAIWKRKVFQLCRQRRPDLIHVHDLPLAAVALDIREALGIPVVLDLHENYPEMLRLASDSTAGFDSRNWKGRLSSLMVSIQRWMDYEEAAVGAADALVVVCEESKRRLVSMGIDPQKVYVAPNYSVHPNRVPSHTPPTRPAWRDVPEAIYAGGVDGSRDLLTVIEGFKEFWEQGGHCNLRIVGAHASARTHLEKLLGGFMPRQAIIEDWMNIDEVVLRINAAEIGLVPHRKSPHTDSTLPHKLFQYMAAGAPVLVSNCLPLERIVTSANCGIVYESGNALSFAKSLQMLTQDRNASQQRGRNGRAAVEQSLNWSTSNAAILGAYDWARFSRGAP